MRRFRVMALAGLLPISILNAEHRLLSLALACGHCALLAWMLLPKEQGK